LGHFAGRFRPCYRSRVLGIVLGGVSGHATRLAGFGEGVTNRECEGG
jgi:hypothetical protein